MQDMEHVIKKQDNVFVKHFGCKILYKCILEMENPIVVSIQNIPCCI